MRQRRKRFWNGDRLDDNWTVETGDGGPYFKTNMVVFHTRILITKLRMVQPIGVMKMQLIKNTRRRTQTVNTAVSAQQEREK